MRNKITLILTVFEPKENELDYWFEVYSSDKINQEYFHVLVDSKITYDKLISKGFKEEHVFYFGEDIGKYKKIIKHINSNNIETKLIKICDPDDYISIDKFSNFEIEDESSIFITSSYKDFDGKTFSNQNEVDAYIDSAEPIFYETLNTPSTILPVEFIKNSKYIVDPLDLNYTLGEDMLLAEIAFATGAEIKRLSDYAFYIYSFKDGMSSPGNAFRRESDIFFLRDSILKIRELSGRNSGVKTISVMLELSDKRVGNEKQFSGDPLEMEKFIYLIKLLVEAGL